MIEFFSVYLWAVPFVVFHEAGHAVLAVRQGIYEGWGVLPHPHVKMSEVYASRWGYLSGIAGSLFAYPFYVIFEGGGATFFIFLAIGLGALDLVALVGYDRADEDGNITLFDSDWITGKTGGEP